MQHFLKDKFENINTCRCILFSHIAQEFSSIFQKEILEHQEIFFFFLKKRSFFGILES